MTNDIAEVIHDLLKELSSEIDLHYEPEDYFALAATFETMKRAGKLLEAGGFPIPPVYVHAVARFNSQRN